MSLAASVASADAEVGLYKDCGAPYGDELWGPGDEILPVRKVFSLSDVGLSWRFLFCDRIPSKIWLATAIDIPQKSGTR